jgi:PAS domain S-box-containing protein
VSGRCALGPFLTLNAVLIGFFGFAAIYHFVLWLQSRRQVVLLVFAIHCLLLSAFSADVLALVTAQTPREGQRALDLRVDIVFLSHISAVWVLSLLSGVRAKRFVWFITAMFLAATVANVAILPLTGTVTAVEQISTAWGEQIAALHRGPQSPWFVVPYALAFSLYTFGFVCAKHLWSRDRIGGGLLAVASGASIAGLLNGARIDVTGSQALYVGALPYAVWVLLFAVLIARDYHRRGERLAATQQRFRAIFDQTFQFIGLMSVDGTLLEANQTALGFAGIRAEDVIGKPLWETAWWAHSAPLQEQLRQAVGAAAAGEVVRFEATHRAADGGLRFVDFSVKPVRDDRGFVVLLIPEGRDVTERKEAEQTVAESREQLQRLAGGLIMAREEERTTIAREIHDVLGQTLTALKMDTGWIGSRLPDASAALRAKLAAMSALIDDAVATVRRIATDLRPGVLDDLGLAAAIEWQVQQFQQRTGIPCTVHLGVAHDELDPLVSTAMFRILQESLTNVARHSHASRVTVTLEHRGGDLVLEVRDDGVGIAPEDASTARSIGLTGMRERAQLVGGECSISGAAAGGTTVCVRVPQREAVGT